MTNIVSQADNSPFDAIRQVDAQNNEFWMARDLMPLLGYQKWERFEGAIDRAKVACQNSGLPELEHFFPEVGKSLTKPKDDYRLSRYACYLVAMNGDPRKPEIAMAQSYFAIKTREAELAPQPVNRIMPTRDAVDYIEAAAKLDSLSEGILKHLLKDALVDQVSLEQNLKYLPFADKPKQYTIAKVRAKSLGYSDMQIGDGSQLGRFIKSQIEPAFQEQVGRYPVFHYEITGDLDTAIHRYFNR